MALFRVDFSGRGELADRQQKLAQLLARYCHRLIILSQILIVIILFIWLYKLKLYQFWCVYLITTIQVTENIRRV